MNQIVDDNVRKNSKAYIICEFAYRAPHFPPVGLAEMKIYNNGGVLNVMLLRGSVTRLAIGFPSKHQDFRVTLYLKNSGVDNSV